jgi:hypothetical protein
MIVDATKEGCRRVLANHLDDQVRASRVLVNEIGNIMDEAGNDDQGSLQSLFLDW